MAAPKVYFIHWRIISPFLLFYIVAAGVTRSVAFGTSNVIAADLFRQYSANGVMILAMFPYGLGGLLNAPISGIFITVG